MKNHKKIILLKSAMMLVFAFLLAISLQFVWEPAQNRWVLLLIPFMAFLINFVGFLSGTNNNAKKNFGTVIVILFGIKFLSYLIFAIVFFLIEKENFERLIFISFIFIVYLLNTIVLLSAVLNYQKTLSKNDGISK
ncbi:MAG TPA: hypothetical protein DDX98_08235 [Bacteroidales bacterium]|nr:hypothetical protein [Bacteroidales bacterium]